MKNFLCLWFVLGLVDRSLCEDPTSITAEPGQNVTLTCTADKNCKVSVVRLTRDDLEPRYVFLYRDEQINKDLQNPQYLGRTELQSLYSTDGNVSLTINNVRQNDSGVYECRVKTELKSNTRRKRAVFENTIIHLKVAAAPPPGRGHIGLVVMVVTMVTMVAGFAGFVWKKRTASPPQDETVDPLQA